jgi:hypothetical protein
MIISTLIIWMKHYIMINFKEFESMMLWHPEYSKNSEVRKQPAVFSSNTHSSTDAVNGKRWGGHAVDTWTALLIDLNDYFDIQNIIWMDLYIRDWKVTLRNQSNSVFSKFRPSPKNVWSPVLNLKLFDLIYFSYLKFR